MEIPGNQVHLDVDDDAWRVGARDGVFERVRDQCDCEYRALKRRDRKAHAIDRDEGLLRIARVNRWTIGGAIAMTGFLSTVAALAHPPTRQGATVPPPADRGFADPDLYLNL